MRIRAPRRAQWGTTESIQSRSVGRDWRTPQPVIARAALAADGGEPCEFCGDGPCIANCEEQQRAADGGEQSAVGNPAAEEAEDTQSREGMVTSPGA